MYKVVAYVLDGHFNDEYMLLDVAGLVRCPACKGLLERPDLVPAFKMRKRRDVSATYDGYTIVSQRFIDEWLVNRGSGLRFGALPNVPGFFVVQANRVVEFDSERRKTEFTKFCSHCGRFQSIAGATPAFLKVAPEALSETEAVRTDLEFGGGDERSPLIIIPLAIGNALKRARLSGMDLAEVWA